LPSFLREPPILSSLVSSASAGAIPRASSLTPNGIQLSLVQSRQPWLIVLWVRWLWHFRQKLDVEAVEGVVGADQACATRHRTCVDQTLGALATRLPALADRHQPVCTPAGLSLLRLWRLTAARRRSRAFAVRQNWRLFTLLLALALEVHHPPARLRQVCTLKHQLIRRGRSTAAVPRPRDAGAFIGTQRQPITRNVPRVVAAHIALQLCRGLTTLSLQSVQPLAFKRGIIE